MRTHASAVLKGLFLLGLLLGFGQTSLAQNEGPRIVQPVDESKLVFLKGNIRPEANARTDRGPVPDEFRMAHMFLELRRSPQQEQTLNQLIEQLHDRKSAYFHRWLKAEEFGQKFGLADEDITKITGWLRSHGFEVNVVYPNKVVIDFSGTAGQVRSAFHTEIHYLAVEGVRHIANMRDPQIPAALAPVIVGVVSLNDFKPHPMFTTPGPCFSPALPTLPSNCYSVVPADLATIYSFNALFAKGISGQGQTIIVLELSNVFDPSDWASFRSTFGLSTFNSGSFSQIHPPSTGVNNCTDPGSTGDSNESEATIDVEWASAAAPNAAIVLASCASTASNLGIFIAFENLLNTTGGPPAIVSISFGVSESIPGEAFNASINMLYQQAVAEGVSVFVAAGDQAAASTDRDANAATHGLNVNGFGSTPFNVAVGGTDFSDTFSGTNSNFWGTTNGNNFGSALSYIPEIPWNFSCASQLIAAFASGSNTTFGSNGFCNSMTGANFLTTFGGGGGPSSCATGIPSVPGIGGGTCLGYAKPSWQLLIGNPADGVRDLPDVSLFAAGNGSGGVWGHSYIFCWSDPSQFGKGALPCTGTPDTWSHAGGTSFAAPIMAGIQALVNQKTGGRSGNPNPTYYSLAAAEFGANGNPSCESSLGKAVSSQCTFYDVTQGDTDVPCSLNLDLGVLIDCFAPSGTFGVLSTSNSTFEPAFAAHTGWDFATGIGTVNVANLVNNFASGGVVGQFSVSSNPASFNFAAGSSGTSTVTVTGTNGFTGVVNFSCAVSPVPVNDPPTCFILPQSVALDAKTTNATSTLKVSTIKGLNGQAFPANDKNKRVYLASGGTLTLIGGFLIGFKQRKRRWISALGLLAGICVGLILVACGGGGGSSQIDLGTPSGGYTVTVAASSGGRTQTTTVTLNVQ